MLISIKEEIEKALNLKLKDMNFEGDDDGYQDLYEEITLNGKQLSNIGTIELWSWKNYLYSQEDCVSNIFEIIG